jgi:hypothetical protein
MDIQDLMRADIRRRNWDRLHIAAERREGFMLGDARVRCRGGERIVVRSEVR